MNHRLRQVIFFLSSVFFLLFSVCTFAEEFLFSNPEQTISLDFKDASLKDVLKIFSIQSGLNFVASEIVEDRALTLYLENVPVKDAMDKIFKANNLTYELDPESKIFIVKEWGRPSIEIITKVFPLKYARVPTSKLSAEISTALIAGGKGEKEKEGEKKEGGKGGGGEAAGEVGLGIIEAVELILSEYGKITEDARTNSLIITDVPAKFPLIEETIARLDLPLPQVLIEVEMLDVSKDAVDKLGIKFSEEWLRIHQGSTVGTTLPFARRLFKTGVNAPPKGFTTGILSAGNFFAALEFLTTQTGTKILARPRILTLSNETAEIGIVKDEIVGMEIEEEFDDKGQKTSSTVKYRRASELKLTPEGIGVYLRVTPQVNPTTGEITMLIRPKTSSTRLSPYIPKAVTTFALDPEIRSSNSVVKVRDGETIVLGGLIRHERDEAITKVPFLGDIPLLGALFRHRSKSKDQERELLVFITPHILKEEALAKVEVKPEVLEREQEPIFSERKEMIEKTLKNFEKEY